MSKPSRRRQPPSATYPSQPAPGSDASRGPVRPSTSPTGSPRVGRRERARAAYKPSFTERYRTPIVAIAAIAGVVLISAFVFASAAAPAYACTQEWTPSPTASPSAGASPNPGYVQPDMGNRHIGNGEKARYTYCPPASGPHYNASGIGPIAPRLYGPGDRALPEGWVHNLEHGAMVILYRGRDGDPGPTPETQAALSTLFDDFPPSPICGIQPGTSQGPVIARFDDMATPFAALVWGRALPLNELDTAQILEFWQIWGERTNPEPLCAEASPIPSAEASASASPATSPEASASAGPATSAAPSASPS